MNIIKIGPITMAIGLIVTGTVLLLGNFMEHEFLINAWKLWPLLLIGLGVEYLIRNNLSKSSAEKVELKFSWLSIIVVGLIIFAGFTANVAYRIAGAANVEELIKTQIMHNAVSYTTPFEKEPVELTENGGSLKIDNQNGTISVKESDDNKVYIKGEITAGGPDEKEAKAKAEQVQIEVQGEKDILVEAALPAYLNRRQSVSVNFEVLVPKGLRLDIMNKSGEVVVRNVEGPVKIDSQMGAIRVTDIKGAVELQSEVGSVNATRISGDLTSTSQTGSIQIIDPGGAVKSETSHGSIELTSSNPLSSDYALKTQNGSINIVLPSDSNLKIRAQTDNGHVEGPEEFFNTGNSPRNKLEGKLGEGNKGQLLASSKTGLISLKLR